VVHGIGAAATDADYFDDGAFALWKIEVHDSLIFPIIFRRFKSVIKEKSARLGASLFSLMTDPPENYRVVYARILSLVHTSGNQFYRMFCGLKQVWLELLNYSIGFKRSIWAGPQVPGEFLRE
jgi:hypothetical protein